MVLILPVWISKKIVTNIGDKVIINFKIKLEKLIKIKLNSFLIFVIFFFSSLWEKKIKKKSIYPNKNLIIFFLKLILRKINNDKINTNIEINVSKLK